MRDSCTPERRFLRRHDGAFADGLALPPNAQLARDTAFMNDYHLDEARTPELRALLDRHGGGLGQLHEGVAEGVDDEGPVRGFRRGVLANAERRSEHARSSERARALGREAEGEEVRRLEVTDRALPDRVPEVNGA